MSLPDSELLSHRLPQLPLLRTICGPGSRDRHPQCPGAHQRCVSKEAGLWDQTGLDLRLVCVTMASLGLSLSGSVCSPHSKDKRSCCLGCALQSSVHSVLLCLSWRSLPAGRGTPRDSGRLEGPDLPQGAGRAFWRSRYPNEVKLGEPGEMQKKQLCYTLCSCFLCLTLSWMMLGTQ